MPGCVRAAKEEELAGTHEKRPKRLEASGAREIKAREDLKGEEWQPRVQGYSKFDLVMDQGHGCVRHCCERHPDCKELRGEGRRADGGGRHRQGIPDVG